MLKYNSGQKQEIRKARWKYFKHNAYSNKSTFIVDDCNGVLKGKNATNIEHCIDFHGYLETVWYF
jgi:hypothetical protein